MSDQTRSGVPAALLGLALITGAWAWWLIAMPVAVLDDPDGTRVPDSSVTPRGSPDTRVWWT